MKRVFISVLPLIQLRIDANKYFLHYDNYPISVNFEEAKWPSTRSTTLLTGLYNNECKEYTDYSSALTMNQVDDKIHMSDLDGFQDCCDFCKNNEIKSKMLYVENDDDFIDIILLVITGHILNRYITKQQNTVFSEVDFSFIFWEVINYYLLDELHFDICVPILMLEFEDDFIEISETCCIQKMSEIFIRSKYNIGYYDSHFEKLVLDCATHMLVFKGYSLKNENYRSKEAFNDKNAYPLNLINKFFASIRSVTKYPTGYAQLVCMPTNNWINSDCKGNLMGLDGAKAQEYPESFKEYHWLKAHKYITSDLANKTKELFLLLAEDESNALKLAVERLNRSELRNNEEDTILDAIIGLELLLSDNDKGELTYKISSRMATLSTLYDSFPFSPKEVQKSVSQIYRYRSDIVHSRKPRVATKNIKINEINEIAPVKLAIDYLRYAIEILAKHTEYLDVKKIDDLMMQKIESSIPTKIEAF